MPWNNEVYGSSYLEHHLSHIAKQLESSIIGVGMVKFTEFCSRLM